MGSTYSLSNCPSHLELFIVFLICGIFKRRQWVNRLAAHSVDRSLLSDRTNERVTGTCMQFDATTGSALRDIPHSEHFYATRNSIARITCLDQGVHSSLSSMDKLPSVPAISRPQAFRYDRTMGIHSNGDVGYNSQPATTQRLLARRGAFVRKKNGFSVITVHLG